MIIRRQSSFTVFLRSTYIDEFKIKKLKDRGAKIQIWGVGTNLVTSRDQPALGGVYKLAAVRERGGEWKPKVKLSNTPIKVSNPGIQQVRRYRELDGSFAGDMIYDETHPVPPEPTSVSLTIPTSRHAYNDGLTSETLLVPVMRDGKVVYTPPSIHSIRDRVKEQLALLPAEHRKITDNTTYDVGLEENLYETKMSLIAKAGK